MSLGRFSPLWALVPVAGAACAPAATQPGADLTAVPVAERAVERSVTQTAFPREDQRFDVAALEPAIRDAVARVRGTRADITIEYVDDSEFFERARPLLKRLYTSPKISFSNDFLAREWLAVEEADRIVARREVGGLTWSPHLIATHLATALVEPGLPIREADVGDFHNNFRHGVAWFYGESAANVVAGMPTHRALLRASVARDVIGYGFERAYFGAPPRGEAAGVAPIGLSQRFWEEASRDFAHAMYSLGGNRLVEATLKDPPTNLRELIRVAGYANGAPASTLRRTDGGRIGPLGPTFTAGSFGILNYGAMIAAGEITYLPRANGAEGAVVLAEFFADTPPDQTALAGAGHLRRKTLANGNVLLAISDDSDAEADAALAVVESIPGTPRRRWTYVPGVLPAVNAESVCAYQLVGERRHSVCSSVEYPKATEGFFAGFYPVPPLEFAPQLIRALAYSQADHHTPTLRADGARSIRFEQASPPFIGRVTAICGGAASAELLSGGGCTGDACGALTKAIEATMAVPPPDDVPTFCAELAYEKTHDLPEPQIPPGLLVTRP